MVHLGPCTQSVPSLGWKLDTSRKMTKTNDLKLLLCSLAQKNRKSQEVFIQDSKINIGMVMSLVQEVPMENEK